MGGARCLHRSLSKAAMRVVVFPPHPEQPAQFPNALDGQRQDGSLERAARFGGEETAEPSH